MVVPRLRRSRDEFGLLKKIAIAETNQLLDFVVHFPPSLQARSNLPTVGEINRTNDKHCFGRSRAGYGNIR